MRNKPIRSVCLVFNPQKLRAKEEIPKLKSWLSSQKVRVLSLSKLSKADALITLGGDGTILSAAPKAAELNVPVLGINVGRLGFMTSMEMDEMYSELSDWRLGAWSLSERLMLEVKLSSQKQVSYALNDAVIRIGTTSRVISVLASISGESLGRFTGDGLIIATPTGSTAYSLSAQGPVVHPDLNALILTPICPHGFTQKPVVFPSDKVVELKLDTRREIGDVQLCLDGQKVFPLKESDRVTVKPSKMRLKLFHKPSVSYFNVLREKLSWGEN
ncbi:MAG: NAD(+)/NADH kinase [Elusimicrobiota bacterium]